MKKTPVILSLLLATGVAAHAQKEVKPPVPVEPPPPPKVEVVQFAPPAEIDNKDPFFTRNPSVSSFRWQNNIATVIKKDKTQERYNMSKATEKKAFNDKYGEAPAIPPPPPPMPRQAPPPPPAPPVPPGNEV